MRLSFRHVLLIICLAVVVSCKTQFIEKEHSAVNVAVSHDINGTDSSIVSLYAPYKKTLEKDMNRVISFSEVAMDKDKPESLLTNFLADLLLEEGSDIANAKDLAKPDITYFNYGGIRADLPKGNITVGDVFGIMPFENKLMFLELKGTQIQEFLDYIARHKGGSIGGVRMVISDDKAINVEIGGKAIDENATYWLATSDYVANGGDKLNMLKKRLQYVDSGEKLRDAIISYFEKAQKNNKKITAVLDGRISYDN